MLSPVSQESWLPLFLFNAFWRNPTFPKCPQTPESGLSWKAGTSSILLPCWTMPLTLALKARALLIERQVCSMGTALLEDSSVLCQFAKVCSPFSLIFWDSWGQFVDLAPIPECEGGPCYSLYTMLPLCVWHFPCRYIVSQEMYKLWLESKMLSCSSHLSIILIPCCCWKVTRSLWWLGSSDLK